LKVFSFVLFASIATFCACKKEYAKAHLIMTPDYKKGVALLERRNDSAYYYFNRVATMSKDSLLVAMAYNNMAVIQNDEGDYYGAEDMALTSRRYLHEDRVRDQYTLVADYNVLGNSSLNLKNYDEAIDYYERAAALAKNETSKVIALNNKAVVYREKKQYGRAIALYESILAGSKGSKTEYARVVTNLAMVRWLQDTTYQAAPDFLMALALRKQQNDNWGLNSSYAHLADYYTSSRPDSALFYAHGMYAMASRLGSPDDELEALQKLIMLGPARDVKQYFALYRHLNDSVENARNTAKNEFALIRYEAEKNKADNLKLQQDNAEKRVEIIKQRIGLFVSIVGSVLIVGWLVARSRGRMRRHKFIMSKKVHDVVANGLYRIMTDVEHHGIGDQERLLDELEVLYEKSRDISYDQMRDESGDFHLVVTELLGSFGGTGTRVGSAGNDKNLWMTVPEKVKAELKPILQELMVNMKKHSGAANVAVKFERGDGFLIIHYTDDGKGFAPGQHFGNGLTNTGNRIKNRGGRIIFDNNSPNGLKIEIYLPIG